MKIFKDEIVALKKVAPKVVLLFLFLWNFNSINAFDRGQESGISNIPKISNQAKISVLTLAPGQEALFTVFGHTIIRLYDPINKIDIGYNYGLFDFNQPNFYLNFAKGDLLYMMGSDDMDRIFQYYTYFDRTIYESELDLSAEQVQSIYSFLENNKLPENRTYYYDYFYDNCATKVLDVLEEHLKGFEFDENFRMKGATFRTDVTKWTIDKPWGRLGIDLCLGLPMDKVMSPKEQSYAPIYLKELLGSATIQKGATKTALVTKEITHRKTSYLQGMQVPWITPQTAFLIFLWFIIGLTVYGMMTEKSFYIFDGFLFFVIGVLGILLSCIWFLTNHKAAANNFNILWAFPFHFAYAFMVNPKKASKSTNYYFAGIATLNIGLWVFWDALPQALNPSLKPLVLALAIRAISIYYFRLKNRTGISTLIKPVSKAIGKAISKSAV